MQRILRFWSLASVLLGSSIVLAQEELQPSQSDAPAAQRLPRIITSTESAVERGPAPKVYRFDISRSSRRPQPVSMPLAPATADSQVRPAAALISGTREMVRLEDESSLIRREPPKSPLDDPQTLPERANEVPPAEYVPVPWSGGEGCLGGIPTFTHDYCPLYWDDPWRNYCCERTRGHCQWPRFSLSGITGLFSSSPKSVQPCCQPAAPCCDSFSAAPEASVTREPTPTPEIESSPSDRPPSPPKDPPAKRRPPRNAIPQRTNSDTESGI